LALSPGTRLGAYEVLSHIGRGGMGEVYKARDTRLERTVAIKILPSTDPDLRTRFKREAKVIASLQHTNICTLYDVGHQDATDYLVMEYLEGRTLRKVLSERPLPAKVTIRYAIQLCQGLAAAHDRGIVHRDLKPENMVITDAGQLKILDFGLAKSRPPRPTVDDTERDTGAGVVMGTVAYMSPEQIKGEPIDSRSDVFSLGVILYEMVAGRHPFCGANYVETMHAILNSNPSSPSKSDDPVLNILNQIIGRCLEKDRERRFQSAREIFTIRGAQLVLAAPMAEGGVDDRTDAVENVVTYREPPNWLVWSGPILLGSLVFGILALSWLATPTLYLRGCITSSDGSTAILEVTDPVAYRGDDRTIKGSSLLEGADFKIEIGHLVEVSYRDFFGRSGRTGTVYIRSFKRLADTCEEAK
jgi:serine/threonine protein kinase